MLTLEVVFFLAVLVFLDDVVCFLEEVFTLFDVIVCFEEVLFFLDDTVDSEEVVIEEILEDVMTCCSVELLLVFDEVTSIFVEDVKASLLAVQELKTAMTNVSKINNLIFTRCPPYFSVDTFPLGELLAKDSNMLLEAVPVKVIDFSVPSKQELQSGFSMFDELIVIVPVNELHP